FDGGVDFYRSWNEYRNGFGHIYDEYWLGNEKIHKLTQSKQINRVDMIDDALNQENKIVLSKINHKTSSAARMLNETVQDVVMSIPAS
ncbi:hypothetical protein KUTeg_015604, partial [Tegillarca granosa]